MKIIDNFLSETDFNTMNKIVMSNEFPWFYIDHASLAPEDNILQDELALETCGFNHIVYDRDYGVKSFTYNYMTNFFAKISETFGYQERHMLRARFSMKFQKQGFTKDNYNLPHVDYYYPHQTMIYYINDSDGDTRVFDQFYTMTGLDSGIAQKTFSTQHRIEPKANRLLVIDGLQYHTASNPIDYHRRIIFNLNLLPL